MSSCWALLSLALHSSSCYSSSLSLSGTAETGQVFIKEKPYPWLDSGSTKDVCQETRMDIGYRVMAKQFETRSCSCFRGPGVQLSLHTQHFCWGSVWGCREGVWLCRQHPCYPETKAKGTEGCGCTCEVPKELLLWLLEQCWCLITLQSSVCDRVTGALPRITEFWKAGNWVCSFIIAVRNESQIHSSV